MTNKKTSPKILVTIAIILIFIAIFLRQEIVFLIFFFAGAERVVPFISTVCGIGGGILFVIGLILAIIDAKKNPPAESYMAKAIKNKYGDITGTRATATFVAAHKKEDGTYTIEYEYEKEDDTTIVDQYNRDYTYLDAKYFQKIKRFTITYENGSSKIIDEPRPGMIPELAGAPVVSKTPIEGKEQPKKKQPKEEVELVRMFCPYCDCMIKKNADRCQHCGAPIRKFK